MTTLVPAKTEFSLVAYAGAMDSRYPLGEPPPDADYPVRLVPVPEIVFVLGYPEDEYLAYYIHDPAVQIDPTYVWWDTVGATPKDTTGAEFRMATTSSVTGSGSLPTGVTYDATTSRLAYDGTGITNDRQLLTLTVAGQSQQFYVRIAVPDVIWGDGTYWDELPAVYKEGGAQESVPRVWAYLTADYNQSFKGACFTYMSDGDSATTAGIVLVTRGTYDHVNEEIATAEDIEWLTAYSREFVLMLGEPTRGHRPYFMRSDSRSTKFGLGGHNTSAYNAHLKNLTSENIYVSWQPQPGVNPTVEHTWRVRKCDWRLVNGDVLGRWLDPVDDSSVVTRTGEVASRTYPWNMYVELCMFDRCGAYADSGGVGGAAVYMGGGYYATLHVNGCKFLGSFTTKGTAIYPETGLMRCYNTYFSYIADPDVVAMTNRMRLALNIRTSAQLDMFNCEMLIGQHAGETGSQTVPRGFMWCDSGSYSRRYPPIYPDVTAQAAPFSTITIRFTNSNVSTSGGASQLSYEGGAWADAGTPTQEGTTTTWNVVLASTDFASNGRYRLRMRDSASARFTLESLYVELWSYQNSGYWYMAGSRVQDLDDADYPDVEASPKAFVPDDGAVFWSTVDRASGTEAKTRKKFIDRCRVTWDTRPSTTGAAAALGYAVIRDEGSYPVKTTADLYGTVPATWTDLGVTWIANSQFDLGTGVVPWSATQPSLTGLVAHGAGVLPSPRPNPLQVDYLASNVTGDRPTASTVDLPDWWADF